MSGRRRKSRHILLNAGMTVVFFAFLVCGATFVVLAFRPLYYWMIRLLDIPARTGYSFEVCKENYDVLIRYNMFFGPNVLSFPDFPMSISGAQHFKEVKEIFVAMQHIAIASGLLLIPGFVLARKKWAYGWLKATVVLALTVIGAVGLAMLINWNWTFTIMHRILFRNDFWIFNAATDPVILILPDEVFLADGAAILLLMGVGLLVAGLVYRKKRGIPRKKKAK